MIERLTSLQIEDFRIFGGKHLIPLDANTVLIHGSNGTGKSSILYAIELALTGAVRDLQGFTSDYPRCLRNAFTETDAVAALTYRDSGSDRTVVASVDSSSTSVYWESHLSEIDIQFFRERCYLSQNTLGRLLELYLTVDQRTAESPIVSLVKRLLDLELLENLNSGLEDLSRIERTRNAIPSLARLDNSASDLPLLQHRLSTEMRNAETRQQKRIADSLTVFAEFKAFQEFGEWNHESAVALRDVITEEAKSTSLERDLLQLASARSDLEALSHSVRAIDDADATILSLRQDYASCGTKLDTLENALAPLERELLLGLRSLDAAPISDHYSMATGDRLATLARAIDSTLSEARERLQTLSQLDAARVRADDKLQNLNKDLRAVEASILDLTVSLPTSLEQLATISTQIENDICPVCERDFREVSDEPLKVVLSRRVSEMGQIANELVSLAARRSALYVAQREAQFEATSLTNRLSSSNGDTVGNAKRFVAEAERLAALWQAMEDEIKESRLLIEHRARIQDTLQFLDSQKRQADSAATRVAEIAMQLSVPLDNRIGLTDQIDNLILECTNRSVSRQSKVATARNAIESLDQIVNGFVERSSLDEQWLNLSKKLQRTSEARSKIESIIQKGKRLSSGAQEAKRKVVENVFSQSLNSLWADLFERLVKNESFRPQLSDPTSWRRQVRAGINAVTEGCEPFENIGAVHSLGNLNTAALSLFLSLNLVEVPRSRVLLLDDPVQSMDDIHITQLSLLLKELSRQADRQVIIAVHERALFEFLKFELAPSDPTQRLLAINLKRQSEFAGSVVEHEVIEWEPDTVSIQHKKSAS